MHTKKYSALLSVLLHVLVCSISTRMVSGDQLKVLVILAILLMLVNVDNGGG